MGSSASISAPPAMGFSFFFLEQGNKQRTSSPTGHDSSGRLLATPATGAK
jgi:hypothetical protein